MNYDKIFDNIFYPNGEWNSSKWRSFMRYGVKKYSNIVNWFDTRYEVFDSFKEVIVRVHECVEERPVCKTCGGRVKFGHAKNGTHFMTYCCHKCAVNDPEVVQKMMETQIELYGSVGNQAKGIETKIALYGTMNNAAKGALHKNYAEIMVKGMKTKEEKYGDYQEHIKKVRKEKYGYVSPWELPEVIAKCRETKKELYGDEFYNNHEKASQTRSEFSEERKQEIRDKATQTRIERYDDPGYNNSEQAKKTLLLKFGTDNPFKTPAGLAVDRKEAAEKAKQTKLKNGTAVRSKAENEIYNRLAQLFGEDDVHREYKCERYPFYCDFYIESIDTFIECNFHQSHGGKPFESYEKDKEIIKHIKDIFGEDAGLTFTVRDPLKRQTAKENHLKYLEFWNPPQARKWIRKIWKVYNK